MIPTRSLETLTGDIRKSDECLQSLRRSAEIMQDINWFRNGGDELFVGRAGLLCALKWIQKETGVDVSSLLPQTIINQ